MIFQHKNKIQNDGVRTPSFFSSGSTDYTGGTALFKMMKVNIVFPLLNFTVSMGVSSA